MKLETLLEGAAADEISFKLLYELTADKVFRYFVVRTRSREQSLDLTQNVYTELWRALPRFTYQSDDQFYGFLFTIARRTMVRSWRLLRREASLPEGFDLGVPAETKEDYRALLGKVASLPEKQRLVVELRYFADLSFAEIAAALKITENNAKVIHHRALLALQTVASTYA